jgi:hypothetical protein
VSPGVLCASVTESGGFRYFKFMLIKQERMTQEEIDEIMSRCERCACCIARVGWVTLGWSAWFGRHSIWCVVQV